MIVTGLHRVILDMYVSRKVQRNSNPQALSSETKNQPYCKTGIIFKND